MYDRLYMPKLIKGSQEAKDRMNHIRSLRKKKGGAIPDTPSPVAPKDSDSEKDEKETIGEGKKTNSWIKHVQAFAKAHNMTYFTALKDPKVKEGYKK